MFIEDYILCIAGYGKWIFSSTTISSLSPQDATFFESVALSISNGNALTEKQSILALKLIRSNIPKLDSKLFPNVQADLDNPKWKFPFRVLPKFKRITVGKHEQPARYYNGTCILIEFPFETDIVESFRRRNSEVHELHKGNWDANLKQWVFACTEVNIDWVGNFLLSRGFQADNTFLELYAAVSDVLPNMENVMPMLVQEDDSIKLKNTHKNIPQPPTNNLVESLFWAREYGVTVWDDIIDNRIENEIHPVTKTILSVAPRKHPWINNNIHDVYAFTDLITYGGPALVIIPGGSELELVKEWAEFARNIGIKTEEMSVMFRLPNDQSAFNLFVKERELNGPVTENTRLVFVSTKITKPLVKSGIKFNTVINLGYYNYMHFSMSTVVDNARNLVYYSMKQPTKNNKWLPQEL